MPCIICRKKSSIYLKCSFCEKQMCLKCIPVEIHECEEINKCYDQQKEDLRKKIYNEAIKSDSLRTPKIQ